MRPPDRTAPAGELLRARLAEGGILPFIGVYDAFSASLAARHFSALFLSGFSFAASHYGLPDIGFLAWPDVLGAVQRIRRVVPDRHLLVDIDDGYCDTEVACHVVAQLEALGASGVVLEDQKRPRRCGHMGGKQILELDEYLAKLKAVLRSRRDLVVVARTDVQDPAEAQRRVAAFREAGADAVLVDGVASLALVEEVARRVDCPVVFNQLAGGVSPVCSLPELARRGVAMVIYSTPCLFAAQAAMERSLSQLAAGDGSLAGLRERDASLAECNRILFENLAAGRRDA